MIGSWLNTPETIAAIEQNLYERYGVWHAFDDANAYMLNDAIR